MNVAELRRTGIFIPADLQSFEPALGSQATSTEPRPKLRRPWEVGASREIEQQVEQLEDPKCSTCTRLREGHSDLADGQGRRPPNQRAEILRDLTAARKGELANVIALGGQYEDRWMDQAVLGCISETGSAAWTSMRQEPWS